MPPQSCHFWAHVAVQCAQARPCFQTWLNAALRNSGLTSFSSYHLISHAASRIFEAQAYLGTLPASHYGRIQFQPT